jgi:hypothetical protein
MYPYSTTDDQMLYKTTSTFEGSEDYQLQYMPGGIPANYKEDELFTFGTAGYIMSASRDYGVRAIVGSGENNECYVMNVEQYF